MSLPESTTAHTTTATIGPPTAGVPPAARRSTFRIVVPVAMASAVLGGAAVWFGAVPLASSGSSPVVGAVTAADHDDDDDSGDPGIVILPRAKWPVAGIRIETAKNSDVTAADWVTGKVALNGDRLAQIDPLVEGIVRDVRVRFGDDVTAGQVLAIIDSREVGQAKLDLFRNRLATRLAGTEATWQREIEGNTQALIDRLKAGILISEIEQQFADKAMGSYREQLVSAYARLHKSRADRDRLKDLSEKRVVAVKEYIAAKAAFEGDQATLQALLEQIHFAARQNRLTADQALEQARTAESISETNLRIMGLGDVAMDEFDPTKEGETVSHYTITAPFDGTIIEKDVVLKERVGPASQLFVVADLRTVWITADIYERHMPMLTRLQGQSIRFRTAVWPGRTFAARVFSTGSVISEESRTLPMMAVAENPQRLLRPGMFIEVEIPGEDVADTLVIPNSALQEHEGLPFVFIHLNDDEFQRCDVRTGRSFDDVTEIVAGLEPGDNVVVEGGFFLKSQMLQEQFADDD